MRTEKKFGELGHGQGFSLIELLIVVAIILIIAAIAIPNLLRARIASNESSAASSVRSIATAEIAYNAAYPTLGYAAALTNLGGPATRMHSEFGDGLHHRQCAFERDQERIHFVAAGFSGSGAPTTRLSAVPPRCIQSDGRPQFLHRHGRRLAQQSWRLGRSARTRRSRPARPMPRAIIKKFGRYLGEGTTP